MRVVKRSSRRFLLEQGVEQTVMILSGATDGQQLARRIEADRVVAGREGSRLRLRFLGPERTCHE